jgi:hypothetical protein
VPQWDATNALRRKRKRRNAADIDLILAQQQKPVRQKTLMKKQKHDEPSESKEGDVDSDISSEDDVDSDISSEDDEQKRCLRIGDVIRYRPGIRNVLSVPGQSAIRVITSVTPAPSCAINVHSCFGVFSDNDSIKRVHIMNRDIDVPDHDAYNPDHLILLPEGKEWRPIRALRLIEGRV